MTKEQTEYFLSLLGALVDQQVKQANALTRISKTLNSLDEQLADLSHHVRSIRYGGES